MNISFISPLPMRDSFRCRTPTVIQTPAEYVQCASGAPAQEALWFLALVSLLMELNYACMLPPSPLCVYLESRSWPFCRAFMCDMVDSFGVVCIGHDPPPPLLLLLHMVAVQCGLCSETNIFGLTLSPDKIITFTEWIVSSHSDTHTTHTRSHT